jgi:uracil-DNA glycosylase
MIWEKFEEQFHPSWHNKIRPFIESEECDRIYEFLKKESKRGKKIAPLSSNTFRCFKETSFDDLKLVIVGISPYHTLRNGEPVADGLCMGCSVTKILQPSLDQWYRAIEDELYKGLNVHFIKNPDLTFLANQGVLLLNAALTTEIGKAGNHVQLWEPFMKFLFENVLDTTGVPVVFLGKDAAKLERYVMPFTWVFKVSHPASASYNNIEWDSEGLFKKVNKLLKDRNNELIEWMDLGLPF